jgi:hypothetical protein
MIILPLKPLLSKPGQSLFLYFAHGTNLKSLFYKTKSRKAAFEQGRFQGNTISVAATMKMSCRAGHSACLVPVGSDGPEVALWVNPDQLAAIILSASVYKLSFLSEPSA